MKLAFFELEDWQKDFLNERFSDHELLLFDGPLADEQLDSMGDVEVLGVFIYSQVTRDVLDRLPELKLVVTLSTGFDHIDLEAAKEKGVSVCNVPVYGECTVAEHTFALILAASRKIFQSIERTHHHHRFETDVSLRGFDLMGKTIGIIGCGNIGKHVARIARGFMMKILVFDVYPDEAHALELGFDYVDMDRLLSESDVITLHTPYNEHTHHIIDSEAFSKMKDGVMVVNTARGGLIETKALVHALQEGKVGAAALDVLESECEVKEEAALLTDQFKSECDLSIVLDNHLLMKLDNVVVTPHNAFNSVEALERIIHTTADNIDRFVAGDPKNVVNE